MNNRLWITYDDSLGLQKVQARIDETYEGHILLIVTVKLFSDSHCVSLLVSAEKGHVAQHFCNCMLGLRLI